MSVFGIRQKLKSGIKKVIGGSPTDTTPPNWQSRGADEVYTKPSAAPAPAPVEEAPPVEAAPEAEAVPEPPAEVAESAPAESTEEAAPAAPTEGGETVDAQDDTAGPPINFDDVQEILDDMVRPALQGDGGDITLLKI